MRYTRYPEIAAVARIMNKNSARAAIKSLEYHLVGSRNSEMKPMLSDSQPWSEAPPCRSKHWGGDPTLGCRMLAQIAAHHGTSMNRMFPKRTTHPPQYDKQIAASPTPRAVPHP